MKTNNSLVVAVVVFSIFASSAFAVLRPPYPRKAYPADRIILNGEERHDWTGDSVSKIEMNTLVTEQITPFLLRSDTRTL